MSNLSSLITQTIGSSSGGVNLITAPSSASIWTGTGGVTVTTTTTAAELPLEGFSSTAVKFALSASVGTAYCDFDCPTALQNFLLQLLWYSRASSAFTASITLSINSYSSSGNRTSNTSPTVVTPQVSTVVGAGINFETNFLSTSNQYLRLTLSFGAQASAWYSIAQFGIGPSNRTQGPALGEWTNFTTTMSAGFGGGTASGLRYKRDASDMLLSGTFQSGTHAASVGTITIPTDFTIDFTKTAASSRGKLGRFEVMNSGGGGLISSTDREGVLFTDGSSSVIYFAIQTGTAAFTQNAPTSIASNASYWTIEARIPIAEWASSALNLGQGAQVEYLSSGFSSWVADRSPAGTALPTTTPAGSSEAVAVAYASAWQYPAQVGDRIWIEVQSGGVGPWMPLQTLEIDGIRNDNTNFFGLGVDINSTNMRVYRGKYRGGTGDTWASMTAGTRYRLVKATPSAPVGFGLARSGESGLINYYQEDDTTLAACTFQGNLGGSASASIAIKITRIGRQVTIDIPAGAVVPTTSSIALFSNTNLPTWARPSLAKSTTTIVYNNGAFVTTPGYLYVNTSGRLEFYRDILSTPYTNSTTCGWYQMQITYTV